MHIRAYVECVRAWYGAHVYMVVCDCLLACACVRTYSHLCMCLCVFVCLSAHVYAFFPSERQVSRETSVTSHLHTCQTTLLVYSHSQT